MPLHRVWGRGNSRLMPHVYSFRMVAISERLLPNTWPAVPPSEICLFSHDSLHAHAVSESGEPFMLILCRRRVKFDRNPGCLVRSNPLTLVI